MLLVGGGSVINRPTLSSLQVELGAIPYHVSQNEGQNPLSPISYKNQKYANPFSSLVWKLIFC